MIDITSERELLSMFTDSFLFGGDSRKTMLDVSPWETRFSETKTPLLEDTESSWIQEQILTCFPVMLSKKSQRLLINIVKNTLLCAAG